MITKVTEFRGPYIFLSNMYWEPDGTCVEVEYQRAKCKHAHDRKLFERPGLSGADAKYLHKPGLIAVREDWHDVKVEIMTFYVTKKFRDHLALRGMLEMTKDMVLEEGNYWHDQFWGICRCRTCNNVGANALGAILMDVRGELL